MSTTSAKMRSPVEAGEQATSPWLMLGLLLGVGLIVRLFFITNEGFRNDVEAFESWSLTLVAQPFSLFYAKAGFADYPPGYFYILWIVGHLYAPFHGIDGSGLILRAFVKLPAILADLAVGVLLYRIGERFANRTWGLIAAAVYVLNPAMIYISAAWGQIDSIAGGLVLLAAFLLLRSDDVEEQRSRWFIVGAWLALSYSLLIKPQGAILVPLFLAYALSNRERLRVRVFATLGGIAAGLVLAYLLSIPFHPTANPIELFSWLKDRYLYGSGVYKVNSVNAFNLWSIKWNFWQDDSVADLGLPQYIWGILLVLAATGLVVARYLQLRTQRAFLEAAALLTIAFFILATRMHERYIFDGVLFTIALFFAGQRYRIAAVLLSITLFANLMYSLDYLHVMDAKLPVDATNLMPWLSKPFSLVNVAVFFFLGYSYLGTEATVPQVPERMGSTSEAKVGSVAEYQEPRRVRTWFDPREGLAFMRWPLDYALAALLGAASFVLSYVHYWLPAEKIFDEIYFARAAEEYLKRQYIYESTHPPLTKLLITVSTWMFGGLAHGDNAAGWRFLDVVFGALTVVLLYVLAKRITQSSVFSAIAAGLLLFDGMHFVQSRIATPEAFVGFFSLATVYCFYRYWIASQVRRADDLDDVQLRIRIIGTLACFALAVIVSFVRFSGESTAAKILSTIYFFAAFYLLFRGVLMPWLWPAVRKFSSYPDGTRVHARGNAYYMQLPDGGEVDSSDRPNAGDMTMVQKGALVLVDDDLRATYRKDGTLEYATPVSAAVYAPQQTLIDGAATGFGRARLWLALFAVAITALVTSKWYGVMSYPATLGIIAFVWAQPRIAQLLRNYASRKRGPAKWGNPYGFALDVIVATLIFIGGTLYFAAYTPQFIGIHDTPGAPLHAYTFSEIVSQQQGMYEYHHNLVASHPYASKWYQWPLDLRPIAYYWKDLRPPKESNNPNACCVAEITSLPNPAILWFGIFGVAFVGYLAWRERNKGYLLLIVTYLLLWLPWARSPRISFAYHFYVDIPIICLCNAIALQRLWQWGIAQPGRRYIAVGIIAGYCALVAGAFAFFYPLLAGVPMVWHEWNIRTLPWLMGASWV